MTNDFYDLLGVDEDASKEEIRDAFREMVQEYHPDRNDDPRATAQFTAIKKAYDTLKNSSERQSYDRLGHSTYVAKRMDGMPDPSSWPSEDEDDSGTSGSSSTSTATGSSTSSRSSTTSGSSSTTGSSSGAGRSGTSNRGPGSSGSGRAGARSTTGSTSRSSTSSSTSGSSSSTSGSSRSGSGSSRGSSSGSRSTTSGSSTSTSTASNAGSNAGSGSAPGSTVGDGGTAHAGAADAAANAAGTAASGGGTGQASGSTSDSGSIADNAVVQWFQRALFGWPSIVLSTALYLSGLAYYGYSNRSGLAALAEALRAAGADTAALRAALEGQRYGIAPATEYVSATPPSDPGSAASWLFAAGVALLPILFFLVIRATRKYPGWKPTYLYVVGVAAPAIGVGATVARGGVPLAAELLAYGVLPVLAIVALFGRGFVWPRLTALGS